ncbi:MAG: urea amidolyase family protein [Nakamurella sp.]
MGVAVRVAAMGELAVLVTPPQPEQVLMLYAGFLQTPIDGQVDVVPGAESVLIVFDGRERIRSACGMVRVRALEALARPFDLDTVVSAAIVRIDAVYDGTDLDEVACLTGLSREAVIAAHTSMDWQVSFIGFAPGFGYLSGGDKRLRVPRRSSPRTEVPSGAIGLAGEYSGIYPRASPGGWQLIGHSDTPLWGIHRDPPALLRPGMRVRFRATRAKAVTTHETRGGASRTATRTLSGESASVGTVTVIRPGTLCLVQDLGRAGRASLGVSPSGAADHGAARSANHLVGNSPGAAELEILLGGAVFRIDADATIAVTGAEVPVTINTGADRDSEGRISADQFSADRGSADRHGGKRTVPNNIAVRVPAGSTIRLGRPTHGLRSYLAVRGGIDVTPVLGSRSADLLAGLGLAPLRADDVLLIGRSYEADLPAVELSAIEGPTGSEIHASAIRFGPVELAILSGPQQDCLTPAALAELTSAEWTVSPKSNRVGIRLDGPRLVENVIPEIPSQPVVRGAIQLTPSGELVAFLADYPVTGGYPVIAVLTEASADLTAQLRPGSTARFHRVL